MMTGTLLDLPLELFIRISEHTTFADLWYLATCSRYCRKMAYKVIRHRYKIDLNKPQLTDFNMLVYGALAYISRYGYKKYENIDHSVIQSVCNRLAVEIFEKSPSKNWEYCIDYYLDKTIGIVIDHVMLDTYLDTVPPHTAIINSRDGNSQVLLSEFKPTRMGKLVTTFLSTFHSTLQGLFEAEPTTDIYHRLLLTHLNRQMDSMTSKYQLISSPIHNELRLNVRILIRLIGTLAQTDLITIVDLEVMTRQRIINSLFKTPQKDTEFQLQIFLDLSRAILLEQDSRTDFTALLNDRISSLVSKSNE